MQCSQIRQLSLIASLALFAGCGGTPAEVDTAEVTLPQSTKPATEPAKSTTEPAKETPAKADPKPE